MVLKKIRFKKMHHSKKGFSLVEVLLVTGIIVATLGGLIQLFIYCSLLSELSGNLTIVLSEAQGKLEEIRSHNYGLIVTDYSSGGTPGNTFDLTQVTGKGMIYIDSTNPDLLKVEIMASWKNKKSGRIVGEDSNLNGAIDAGEDLNSNGKLDSMATLVSWIARR